MDRTTLRELRRKGKRLPVLEKTLRELEQRYCLLESTFPDPLVFCDSSGKVEHVNAPFEETFGWKADEVFGMVAPYVPRSERTAHLKRLRAVADGREPPFQFQGRSKNGEVLDLLALASVYEGETDGPAGFLTVLKLAIPHEEPRGKQYRTRKQTREHDAYERHFHGSNVGMIVADLDTGTVCFNRKLAEMIDCRLTRAGTAESEGAFLRIRESAGGQILWEMIGKGMGNPGADIQFTRANGKSATVLASVSVLRKRPGRSPVVGATIVDMTKRKVREDRLKAENDEMMKRSEDLEKGLARTLGELNVTKQKLSKVRAGMIEVNKASKLLVSKVAEQKKEFQESIAQNLDLIVHPLLHHLKTTNLSEAQLQLVDTVDFNLKHIAARFGVDLHDRKHRLSPREIQICRMIRSGKDSAAIAEAFGLARQTVVVHRKNIRKKLGLKKNKQNLATYLMEHM